MKPYFRILFLSGLAFVACSCSKGNKDSESTARYVPAPAIGLEESDVLYVNHALFAMIGDDETTVKDREIGFVAVSSSHLFLAEGRPSSFDHKDVIKIPIDQLRNLKNTGLFLEMRYADQTICIMPFQWFSETTDFAKLDILNSIIAQSIPEHPQTTVTKVQFVCNFKR